MNRDRSPSPEIIRPSRRRRTHTGGVQEAEASSQVAAPQPEEALPELQDPLSLSSIEIDENINTLLCNAFEQYLKRTIPGESVDQKLEYITENVKTSPALEQPSRFPDKIKVMQVIYLQDMKLSLKNMKEETPSLWSFDNPGEINLPAYLKPGSRRADRKALLVYTEIVRKMLILLGASEYNAIGTDLIGSLLERMYQTRKSYLDTLWLHAGNVNEMDSVKVMVFKIDWGIKSPTYLAIKEETGQLQAANEDVEFQRLKIYKIFYSVAEFEALVENPSNVDIFSKSGRCDVRLVLEMRFGVIYWATRAFRRPTSDYQTIWFWHEENAYESFEFYSLSLEIISNEGRPNFEGIEEKVFGIFCKIVFWILDYFQCVGTRVMGQQHLVEIIKKCYLVFEPFQLDKFFKYATYAGGDLLLNCLDEKGKEEIGLTESARILVRVAPAQGDGARDTFYSIST